MGDFTTIRPPLAATSAVSGVGSTSATIGGSVNANRGNVDVAFEFATAAQGLGTKASTTTLATPPTASGVTDTSVSTNLIGLLPGTSYVVRALVSDFGLVTYGVSRTFTTNATIVSSGLTPVYTGLPVVMNTVTQPADLELARVFEGVGSTDYPSSSTPPTELARTWSQRSLPTTTSAAREIVDLTILPKPVTVTATVTDRPYDGTTTAALVVGLVGAVDGDDVHADSTHLSGAFDDADASADKTVNITVTGALLTGADAANYAPTVAAETNAAIERATQTISFTSSPPTPAAVGSTYVPVVVSNRALTPSVTIGTGDGVTCSLSAGTLTFLSPGTCTLVGSQAGTGNYEAAVAIEQSFTVVLARVSQTITVGGLHDTELNGVAPVLPAVTTSNLPLTYLASPSSVCTVVGTTITLHGLGLCTITADQAGDSTHLPATATGTFMVTAISQIVTITGLVDISIDASPLHVAGSSSSGLPLVYTAGPQNVCTVSGAELTLVAEGTCTVVANQIGDSTHSPATASVAFVVLPRCFISRCNSRSARMLQMQRSW